MNTNQIGSVTEAVVLAALVKAGRRVVVPFGNYGDYDLLIDESDRFLKVQCKTGKLSNGVVKFSNYVHCSGKSRRYGKSVDLYGVYCPQNGKTYLVPTAKSANDKTSLRVDPPKNGYRKILNAVDYEI